jgi:two-component system chemotaxis sensor kinase CheA
MGYAAMIKDEMLGGVNSEQKRALEKVITRSSDLLNMITSILYATSIEAKEVRLQNSRFAPADLIEELKRVYEISLLKSIALTWEYPADLPQVVMDRDKVRVVLQRIIDNAAKFTERGSVAVSVRLCHGHKDGAENGHVEVEASAPAEHWLEFKVKDDGVGIAQEKLPIIFDKFRQADGSETRRFGGVGLGLYIAKHFTELMGGRIEVETEEGKGSTFTVTVPCLIPSSGEENQPSVGAETAGHVDQLH